MSKHFCSFLTLFSFSIAGKRPREKTTTNRAMTCISSVFFSLVFLRLRKKTDWEPILGDIYKLMREPTNEKDVNAVAYVRPKPGQVQTERDVDFHPNILNKEFEVIAKNLS